MITAQKLIKLHIFKASFYKAAILIYLINNSSIALSQSNCNINSLQDLPEVTVTSFSQETEYAPHCKIEGIIGNHINFELLLPENWNGKFVFGGGGGFVGSVINTALGFGVVEKGYAR